MATQVITRLQAALGGSIAAKKSASRFPARHFLISGTARSVESGLSMRRESPSPSAEPGSYHSNIKLPAEERVNELGPEGRESVAPAVKPGFRTHKGTARAGRKSWCAGILRAYGAGFLDELYPASRPGL